jgi:hypothetical protein
VKTSGVNLADLPADMPMIPYKEKLHDRKERFGKITKETSVQGTAEQGTSVQKLTSGK